MFRPIFSYALTLLILLSQVGLPMHYHYCKGVLESVSLIFKQACEDEDPALASMPACCKKLLKKHCKDEKNGCCHDKIKVISQEITSITPGFLNWAPVIVEINPQESGTPKFVAQTISPFSYYSIGSDSGPPIYILLHALIYYA